jgi:hypothetical protein
MKRGNLDAPLPVAAARSLRRAAKAAQQRATETNVPLAMWKNGRVVYVRPGTRRLKTVSPRRAA